MCAASKSDCRASRPVIIESSCNGSAKVFGKPPDLSIVFAACRNAEMLRDSTIRAACCGIGANNGVTSFCRHEKANMHVKKTSTKYFRRFIVFILRTKILKIKSQLHYHVESHAVQFGCAIFCNSRLVRRRGIAFVLAPFVHRISPVIFQHHHITGGFCKD